MEIIVFETETFDKLVDKLYLKAFECAERYFKKEEWIGDAEAKALLRIKSKAKLQQLRNKLEIDFTHYGKIIQYNRASIMAFLERHRKSLDNY